MRHYEDLGGAKGRNIYYRAPRYEARELFNAGTVEAQLGEGPLELENVSMTGIAVMDRQGDDTWESSVNGTFPITISMDGRAIHSGLGEVCRVETTSRGRLLGVRFLDGYFDIQKVVVENEELALKAEIESRLSVDISLVPDEYRMLCADVVHVLRSYKQALERFKKRANGKAPIPTETLDQVYRISEQGLLEKWDELWLRANAIVEPLMGDRAVLRSVKRFTELTITPEFMDGPIWRRSYEKPLGYPGDFAIMKMVYDWERAGDSLYGKLMHRIGLEVSECIATRMVKVQQAIAKVLAEKGSDGLARITSLGCGPAKEIRNVLEAPRLPGNGHFTLIDQDQEALADTYACLLPSIVRLNGQAKVNCLQTSFIELIKPGPVFDALPPQDLIYTVGLIDYLNARRTRDLVTALYNKLTPGGTLIVANMAATPKSNLWPMEFITDWSVLYRTQQDMSDLAAGCGDAEIKIGLEETGRVWMMWLKKPAASGGLSKPVAQPSINTFIGFMRSCPGK